MIEAIKSQVREILTAWFPECQVQFEPISDDPNLIGVGVYGVPKSQVKWVKKKIHQLDERLCADAGYVLLPLVRDLETTQKHYPHLQREWKAYDILVFSSSIDLAIGDPTLERFGPRASAGKWRPARGTSPSCNEELALAA